MAEEYEETTEETQEETTEQEETAEESETSEETGEEEAEPATEEEEEKKVVPVKAVIEERRRRQAAEEELKRLKESAEVKTDTPKTIYDFYEENPAGVIDWINAEIQKLSDEDPYSNARKIEELRDQKVELRQWGQRREMEASTTFKTELSKTAPQIDDLTRFAVSDLGYSANEVKFLTQPTANKAEADFKLKTLKLIQRQYEAANAGSTVDKKKTARTPTRVETAGSGIQKPAPKLDKLMSEAKKTGDWTEYFKATGVVTS